MLKISERKNTTNQGLKELQALVDSLKGKFEKDVDKVVSPEFFGKVRVDNGLYDSDYRYKSWINYSAYWQIKDGNLELQSVKQDGEPHPYHNSKIENFKKLNFAEAVTALEKVIEQYNTKTEKKDKQIKKFLNFCAEFQAKQN